MANQEECTSAPPLVLVSSVDSPRAGKASSAFTFESYAHGAFLRMAAVLNRDDDGRVNVHVPSLPGAISWGHSEDEAIGMIEDAVRELVRSYKRQDLPIPWVTEVAFDAQTRLKWVFVSV